MTTQPILGTNQEMATEKISPNNPIKVFQSLNDLLADIWKRDDSRPWEHFIKEQRFRYFWDTQDFTK